MIQNLGSHRMKDVVDEELGLEALHFYIQPASIRFLGKTYRPDGTTSRKQARSAVASWAAARPDRSDEANSRSMTQIRAYA